MTRRPALTLAVAALLLAPLLLVDVPPLLDYPNHLARAVLLATDDPVLRAMFVTNWAVIPNLFSDLVLPPLLHVLPVHVAGRLFVGAVLLLPLFGALAYSRAVFGVRSLWPLAVSLVLYNLASLMGFLNFVAGLGLALLLAAAFIRLRARGDLMVVAVTACGCVVLFFCHLMAVLFFVVLAGATELDRIITARSPRGVWVLPAALVPTLLLYVMSPLAVTGGATEWLTPGAKAVQLLAPVRGYIGALDAATAAILAVCCVLAWPRVPRATWLAMATLALLYVVAPHGFKGTQSLDTRFTFMLALLLFAGTLPTRQQRLVGAALGLLLVARMAVLAAAWHAQARDVADLRAVIADIPAGARVDVAGIPPERAPHDRLARRLSNGTRLDLHLPALVLIERHAFWPFLFDDPAQQPVLWRPEWQALADRTGGVLDTPMLPDVLCGYDFVLLLGADGAPDLAHFGAQLQLVKAREYVALFRVLPGACERKVSG